MTRIVVTGAAGLIGRAMVQELAPHHELVLLDRRPVPGGKEQRTVRADLGREPWGHSWLPRSARRPPRWTRLFGGADAVLHLAANRSPRASWSSVLRNNIQPTWNVLDAARSHGVRRVVYASSFRAVSPLTPYGLSKAWGELAGRMFVDTGGLETFIAVRIGTYAATEPTDAVEPSRWVLPGDLAWILRRCLEADLSGFHLIDGVTERPGSPFDHARTARLLGAREAGGL